jgi:peptidoglycan/xylan/chitin deacetylase (PgdA/CDA1 family)
MIRQPVFIYHHVSESPNISKINNVISPDHFRRQMLFLYQKGFRCLSLPEAVTYFQEGKPQPKRSFVLTFDDGYFDNYEIAAPILKEFGFCATIFVIVKPVEEGNKGYISWRNIRDLAQNNFTFGSHTLTHKRLSSLDKMTIEHEFYDSKMIIEDRLGLLVDLVAYPYGDSDDRVRKLAIQCGYRAACGLNEGHWTPFNIWRVAIKDDESELSYSWKAFGGFSTYNWLKEESNTVRKMRELKRRIQGPRL